MYQIEVEGIKNVEVDQFETVEEVMNFLPHDRILTLVNSGLRSQGRSKANGKKYQERAKVRNRQMKARLAELEAMVKRGQITEAADQDEAGTRVDLSQVA